MATDLLDSAVEKSGFDPTLLVKYVDGALAFISKDELEKFLTILNSENKSIQFTCEFEDDRKIANLAMSLQRTIHNRVHTQFYQKPTSKTDYSTTIPHIL